MRGPHYRTSGSQRRGQDHASAGHTRPHAARKGSVLFNGMEISGLPPHKIAARGISCIPEGRRIFSKMTVEENLLMGAYMEKDKEKIRQRLERVYRIFPRLLERREQFAGTMSGGEQAMVSIGRGLMNEPKLLVIDEPSPGAVPRAGQ